LVDVEVKVTGDEELRGARDSRMVENSSMNLDLEEAGGR
jgi:hypothetical protein